MIGGKNFGGFNLIYVATRIRNLHKDLDWLSCSVAFSSIVGHSAFGYFSATALGKLFSVLDNAISTVFAAEDKSNLIVTLTNLHIYDIIRSSLMFNVCSSILPVIYGKFIEN